MMIFSIRKKRENQKTVKLNLTKKENFQITNFASKHPKKIIRIQAKT